MRWKVMGALALAMTLTSCGKSEAEVRKEIEKETQRLQEQIDKLKQEQRESREKLMKSLCESLCLDLQQLKAIEENVPPAARPEYDGVLQSINSKITSLGCPPCAE